MSRRTPLALLVAPWARRGLLRQPRRGLGSTLRVRNSLLLPSGEANYTVLDLDATQRKDVLKWYSCGPTVYDASHIGHARTYVCTDIIRRILTDVFGLRVDFALGITDIDDKIIARAREEAKKTFTGAAAGVGRSKASSSSAAAAAAASAASAAAPALEWADLVAFARKHERDFFHDMERLGVRPPDAVLRVTEHMPEIVAFVERLLEQGQAYRAHDGIYFDVGACQSYGKLGGNIPRDQEAAESGDEGGGSGASAAEASTGRNNNSNNSSSSSSSSSKREKRGVRDFALWKFARPHEPAHDGGTLGSGRPGWHIECSAMTNSYFGPRLDVHSGGVDLKFPHHTNEIAQSEAHGRCGACADGSDAWVRLWLHTGHIYIQGRKMSKSLKNFISVREYLAAGHSSAPAVDFRLFCLQHRYSATLHYSPERIEEAAALRLRLENFHRLVALVAAQAAPAECGDGAGAAAGVHGGTGAGAGAGGGGGGTDWQAVAKSLKPTADSRALTAAVHEAHSALLARLADDFDTPGALRVLCELTGRATLYANSLTTWLDGGAQSLLAADDLVRRYLGLLGVPVLVPRAAVAGVGVGAGAGAGAGAAGVAAESNKAGEGTGAGGGGDELADVLVELRAAVRGNGLQALKRLRPPSKAKASDSAAAAGAAGAAGAGAVAATPPFSASDAEAVLSQMLQACDKARARAKAAGVVIDDVGAGGSTWRRV